MLASLVLCVTPHIALSIPTHITRGYMTSTMCGAVQKLCWRQVTYKTPAARNSYVSKGSMALLSRHSINASTPGMAHPQAKRQVNSVPQVSDFRNTKCIPHSLLHSCFKHSDIIQQTNLWPQNKDRAAKNISYHRFRNFCPRHSNLSTPLRTGVFSEYTLHLQNGTHLYADENDGSE